MPLRFVREFTVRRLLANGFGLDACSPIPSELSARHGGVRPGRRRSGILAQRKSKPDAHVPLRCRLDFHTTFYLDRNVSADDDGASGSGIGPVGLRRENGAVAFATTHWSVVLAAQGESTEADAAVEKLCR